MPWGLDGLLSRMEGARDDPDGRSIYMGSVPTDTLLPGFADENRLGFLPLAIRPRIWLGTASQVACHYDTFDKIACVVAGRRRFPLYPPAAIVDPYVGPTAPPIAGPPGAPTPGAPPG